MPVLVTGATGFVGSLLVPRLLADRRDVRALARDPARVAPAPGLTVLRGDILTGDGLADALDGVDVAYYLIHSMGRVERSSAGSFPERERLAAHNFAAAATRAGVRRIVYLGGLTPRPSSAGERALSDLAPADRPSPHLASRAEVERILLHAVPDSVALRASIVIGARSRSFRLLVRLVERLPVLALPAWRRFRTQPIDARDVTEMLAAAAAVPGLAGRSLDIGGPDVLTYGEMLQRIAAVMLVGRPAVAFNLNITPIAARLAAAITAEDPELVLPLMEGLTGDLLPADDRAAELLGVHLHSFDAAVERALREWEAHEPLAAR